MTLHEPTRKASSPTGALRVIAGLPEPHRPPPHNLEAEQALLGAILVENECFEHVADIVVAADFFDPLHGRLFEIMAAKIRAAQKVTAVLLKTDVEHLERLSDDLTVPQYLGRLLAEATSTKFVVDYARTVKDLSERRQLIVIGEDAAGAAQERLTDEAKAALIDDLERQIVKLRDSASAVTMEATPASAFQDKPVPRRDWHVRDWIPARNVTILGGDGGTGKSLLALHLAANTSVGRPWLGQPVARGASLVISAEDDIDELHRRLADIAVAENVSLESLSNLHLVSLAGADAVMATFDKSNAMTKTVVCRNVEKLVEKIQPRLVVLDTLADLFGGDEINRSQTRQFVQLLRGIALKFRTTVLLLAHPSVAGMKSGSGTSGSTAWSNSVRSRLYLDRVKETDGDTELDPDARVLSTKKANYGPVGQTVALRWHAGAFRVTSGDADVSDAILASNIRAENAFLELLRLYAEQRRDVSATPSSSYAPAQFVREDIGKLIGKEALTSAMTRLLSTGRIRVEEHGPESKRRKKLVIA